MYCNYLTYQARYTRKDVSDKKISIVFKLYPRWYSPLFWGWSLLILVVALVLDGLNGFLRAIDEISGQFTDPNSEHHFNASWDEPQPIKLIRRLVFVRTYMTT